MARLGARSGARHDPLVYDAATDDIIRRLFVANCSWSEIVIALNSRCDRRQFNVDGVKGHAYNIGLRARHRGRPDILGQRDRDPAGRAQALASLHDRTGGLMGEASERPADPPADPPADVPAEMAVPVADILPSPPDDSPPAMGVLKVDGVVVGHITDVQITYDEPEAPPPGDERPETYAPWTDDMHRALVEARKAGLSYARCAAQLKAQFPEKYFSSASLSEYARENGLSAPRSGGLAVITGEVFQPLTVDDWLWGKEAFDCWDAPALDMRAALWLCKPRKAGQGGWGFYLRLPAYDGICSGGVVDIWRALIDQAISLDDAIAYARRFFFACKEGVPDAVMAQASAYSRTRLDLRKITGRLP